MMELLRKFEEESAQQPDLLAEVEGPDNDGEDQDDLTSKLEGLDLSSCLSNHPYPSNEAISDMVKLFH